MGSKGCKRSSLNVPGTETPLSHPILKLDELPFPIISRRGGSVWKELLMLSGKSYLAELEIELPFEIGK